jgi:acetylornithine/succinyldiaminopimelate/putrescine aminotransferase
MTSLSPVLKQAAPVVVDHALGSWIDATDSQKYLDFTPGIGMTITDHCHTNVPVGLSRLEAAVDAVLGAVPADVGI